MSITSIWKEKKHRPKPAFKLNITPAAAETWDLKDSILKVNHITISYNKVWDTLLLDKSHIDRLPSTFCVSPQTEHHII